MGKRVLVADDSATIQRAFAMVFGAQPDISLIPARSLDEAVAAARQGRPDLVIADVNLGNRTGYELCSAVKADPGLRGVPVVILASNHSPYDEGKGRDAGADGHLLKPFESQGLIDKVNEILSRPVTMPAAAPTREAQPGATPAVARPAPRLAPTPAAEEDDDYGEFKIERSSGSSQVPPGVRSPPTPAPHTPSPFGGGGGLGGPSAAARPSGPSAGFGQPFGAGAGAPAAAGAPAGGFAPSPGLRPSLIPGARPGMVPGRVPTPGAPPVASARPPMPVPPPTPTAPPAFGFGGAATPAQSPAAPSSPPAPGRTIMGLPAVAIPGMAPRAPGPPAGPLSPVTPPPTPGMPASRAQPAPAPLPPPREPAREAPIDIGAAISARRADVEQRLDQKVASISARGPEYEAIAKLSREVIEQVVWEVVPELAEVIIREHVERLAASRK